MPSGVTIILPWLDSKLSPNQKLHRMVEAKLVKKSKLGARKKARDAYNKLGRQLEPPVTAQWIFVPPVKRKRDLDNMTSNKGCKAAVDACVLEGLLEDDNADVLTWEKPEVWQSGHPLLKGQPGVLLLLDEVTLTEEKA